MKSLRTVFLCLIATLLYAHAESSLGWTEEFDNVAQPRWQNIPQCAAIIPKDQLSAANRVVQLAPEKGQQVWLLSSDKFVNGDLEISFCAEPPQPGSGDIFYYIGFHETEPWLKALAWVQIQGTSINFGIKNPEGGTTGKLIGYTNGKYQTLRISQSTGTLKVSLDGEEHIFEGENLLTNEPMPVFIGAFSYDGQADLKVDYVRVSGSKAKERFAPVEQTGESAELAKASPRLFLSSWNTEFNVLLEGGLHWGPVAFQGQPTISSSFFSPVFAMRLGNRTVFSHEFIYRAVRQSENGFAIDLYDPPSRVAATLTARSVPGDRMLMQLALTNEAENEQTVQAIFPILGGIQPGGDLDKVKYFFPWRGGVLGDKTASFKAEYNGFAWMQVMFAYSPDTNLGLGLFPEDGNGRFKGLMMQKGVDGKAPLVQHGEIVIPQEQPSLDLLGIQSGLAFSQYYRGDKLQPGQSTVTPEVRIFTFKGDWKTPLGQYASWMKERMTYVTVPRWFRDSYTWLNAHPQAYYDEEKQEYILHKRLAGGENAIQIAFWDDYPLPFESRKQYPSLASTMPGEFYVNKDRGGVETLAAEVEQCHQRGSAFTLYIDHRFCWRETALGQAHGQEWATKNSIGNYPGYVTADDQYLMCFYDQDKWVQYMTDRCRSLVEGLKLDGIYLDELAVNFECYNEGHDHYKAGNYPTDPHGVAQAMTKVRNAMKEVNPEAALMTEHAGSDYLTQFFDGSWDQTFYTGAFPFVEQYYDDLRINFFHFCFPHFKFSEWGCSTRHPWRNLFNGFGMDMGGFENTDIQRQFAQLMKENGDAFASDALEPIVPTSHEKFLANRFPKTYKVIHTCYNTSEQPLTASILETKPANREWHYVELIEDINITTDSQGFPELTVQPERTAVLACLPQLLTVTKNGNDVNITFDKNEGERLVICEGIDDEHFHHPRGKWTSIDVADGKASYTPNQTNAKLIIKLLRDDYLVDEVIL